MTLNNLGLLDDEQNRWGEARKEAEEAQKIYRELAQKEPETYLPHVAITLNNLGIFDSDKNQMNKSRMEYEEALKIYEAFAKQDPDQFSPLVERMKKLLKQ